MDKYMEYYKENCSLDDLYINKYQDNVDIYYEKNCLELIVEICELANESKCFKYWSKKMVDKEKLLYEFADCLSMLFCIYNYFSMDHIGIHSIDNSLSIVELFNNLISLCTKFMDKDNVKEDDLYDAFSYLYRISKCLELNDDEIIDIAYKKIEINKERLNSDY